MPGRSDALAHYRHCVMGPVAMPSTNVGYPDGDNRPTVTMDLRRSYVMTPDSSGNVSFGLATSYFGCFVKGAGAMTASSQFTNQAILDSGVVVVGSAVSTATANPTSKGLVPMTPLPSGPYAFMAYRPIVAVAEVSFTGSSMHNGGSVVIAKTSTANALDGVHGSVDPCTRYQANQVKPVMSGTTVVGPARDGYTSRIVPADPEFIPAQAAATTAAPSEATDYSNVLISANTHPSGTAKMSSLPCAQAGAVWYSYSGLDPSASITVAVRYCVQYSVPGDSSMAPLARPSPPPPENPGLLNRIFSSIVSSPAALNFAANAVGHLVPASRPLLAIAAEAYNG